MSRGEIRAVDRSCKSYRCGHHVHWIQAKKARQDGQPLLDVTVDVHPDGRVDFDGDGSGISVWTHDPARLQSAWEAYGCALWKPKYHVLRWASGRRASARKGLTPLPAAATTLDRALRDVRELGGCSVRLGDLSEADREELRKLEHGPQQRGDGH